MNFTFSYLLQTVWTYLKLSTLIKMFGTFLLFNFTYRKYQEPELNLMLNSQYHLKYQTLQKTLTLSLSQAIKMITKGLFSVFGINTRQLTQLGLSLFSSEQGSSSKKYTSSFKVRSRLAQFFKHIHPDQMNQAPTKIKDQNMRSLKNFNQYIDAINQQKSIQGKLLKFYISQKTNHKSKKFYSFNLELPELQAAKMNEEKAQRLLDDIVTALKAKFSEAQEGPVKKGKKQGREVMGGKEQVEDKIKIETQEERIQREQQTIKPFEQYRAFKDKLTVERLKNQINAKYMQTQKENLQTKLRQNVSFADTASSRPMMWARLSMNQSGLYKDYQDILNSLIDPKLIYFSQTLTQKQIQQFKKKLLPGGMDPLTLRQNDYINDSFQPPLCFFVDRHYSGSEIPGFFTVPYNFKPKELKQKFDALKGEVQKELETYVQYYDYFKELEKQLREVNNIVVDLKEFKGNQDIADKILMLKRLSRYALEKPSPSSLDAQIKPYSPPTFYPMTPEQYQITVTHYFKSQPQLIPEMIKRSVTEVKVNDKVKIVHLIGYRDEDMMQVVDKINNEVMGRQGQESQVSSKSRVEMV